MYIFVGRGLGDAPSCISTNCSAICSGIPAARFDKQPADLQRVLTKSFPRDPAGWLKNLDPANCSALASIFNRMCRDRLWCHVERVLKIVPGKVRAGRIQFEGATPSVHFLSRSGKALLQALMATGRFCIEPSGGIGGILHRGQHTLREISGSDSLHISIGPGHYFDAHIDRYSPVPVHPGSMFCPQVASPAALLHIGREVLPGWVPGAQVFPEWGPTVPRPEPPTRQEADPPPPMVGVTWRW